MLIVLIWFLNDFISQAARRASLVLIVKKTAFVHYVIMSQGRAIILIKVSTDYICSDGHILRHIWVNARHKNRNHFVEGWQSSIEYAIFYRKYYELQRKQIMTSFSIIIDCQMGMYGVNCVERCGNCKNNETCDIVNGTCPNGCAAGYNGTVCKDGKLLWATIKIYSTQMM